MRSYGFSEAATLTSGRLARLVFRPAVEVRIAEDRRIALFLSRRGEASCSALIVSIHELWAAGHRHTHLCGLLRRAEASC